MSKTIIAAVTLSVLCASGTEGAAETQQPGHAGAGRLPALYAAIASGDAKAVRNAYAKEARFTDNVFRGLTERWQDISRMWAAAGSLKDFKIERVSNVKALPRRQATATWTVSYRSPINGKPVVNRITSTVQLDASGRIVSQRDRFDLPKWMAQALPAGKLLGRFAATRWAFSRGMTAYTKLRNRVALTRAALTGRRPR